MITLQTSHSILTVSSKVTNVGNRALEQAKKSFPYTELTITEPERILSLCDCNGFVFIPKTHQVSFTLLFLHPDLPGHLPYASHALIIGIQGSLHPNPSLPCNLPEMVQVRSALLYSVCAL